MRVVALEEHFTVPDLVRRIDPNAISRRGFRPRKLPANGPNPLQLLPEIGEQRLRSMDEAGITVQVLSNTGPGPDLVPGPCCRCKAPMPPLWRSFERQKTWASWARSSTAQRTAVSSITRAMTDSLRRPWNSTCPSTSIRTSHPKPCGRPITLICNLAHVACLSRLPGDGTETAIHVLRMVLAGTLDRYPRLRLVIGHMGEMLPVMLARIDEVRALDIEHLKRSISRSILDQVWITTSGIFSEPPFLAALQTFGIDRIMFSVDYPYAPNMRGRNFLDGISLAPADMSKLTHRNADAMLKLKVRAM
jgi:uncharacterized protein